MERSPVAPTPKAESIPKLWEAVKDLKPESIMELTNTLVAHGAYEQSDEKRSEEKRSREEFAREWAELEPLSEEERHAWCKAKVAQQARDKRSAEEMQEEEFEEAVSSSKARKIKENIMRRPLANAEGTCANPIPTTGHCCFRCTGKCLIAHVQTHYECSLRPL